jgi:hypothetical protein
MNDADSFDSLGFRMPISSAGTAVQERWCRMSEVNRPPNPFPEKAKQSYTSLDAPAFLSATAQGLDMSQPLAPSSHLLHETRTRQVRLERAGAPLDQRAVSSDTPSWMADTLPRRQPQPALTRPFTKYRLGAANRVMLKPLVEVDPFAGGPPRALPKGPTFGYVPNTQEAAEVEQKSLAAGKERLGLTFSAELGSPGALVDRPRQQQRFHAQERFGLTSSAAFGSGSSAAVLGDLLRSDLHSGPAEVLPSGAVYRSEPPFSAFYRHRRDAQGLPSDAAQSAKWVGVSPAELRAPPSQSAGAALFHSLTMQHGQTPAQHLAAPKEALASSGRGDASLRSGPLHWYNTVR